MFIFLDKSEIGGASAGLWPCSICLLYLSTTTTSYYINNKYLRTSWQTDSMHPRFSSGQPSPSVSNPQISLLPTKGELH